VTIGRCNRVLAPRGVGGGGGEGWEKIQRNEKSRGQVEAPTGIGGDGGREDTCLERGNDKEEVFRGLKRGGSNSVRPLFGKRKEEGILLF